MRPAQHASSQSLLKMTMLTVLATLTLTTFQQANAGAPDYTIHQEYTSTRALGMGNAFTALADDHSALFYNPAALAVRKDSHLRMFIRAGLDSDVLGMKDDIEKAGSDETAITKALDKHMDEHVYFRAPTLGGILVRPKWGLAILPADFSVDAAVHKPVAPSLFVNAYLDSTVAFGKATTWHVPWLQNRLAFGWTGKFIHRAYYSDVIYSTQLAMGEDPVNIDKAAEGYTLDGDIGFLYESKRGEGKWYQPALALVVRNVFDYGFPKNFKVFNDNPPEPPKLQRRLDLGSKFDLPAFWVFDPKLTIDMRDIGHRNWTPMKGFHAGAEMFWKVSNWWKGHWSVGINQGYLTAGFGGKLGIFQLDLATWGEEVGPSEAKHESRRYIAEMSLDF